MKKKFSKEALYQEWKKYQKWYEKQANKDMALSERSRIIAYSFDEYMFYRDDASEGYTRSDDVLGEMKRRSYNTSSRQLEHLTSEIQGWLTDESTTEAERVDFMAHFAGELPMTKDGKIDTRRIVDETLHGRIAPLEMRTGKNHGWYGVLANMMEYIQTLGGRVSWNS